jgi:hypothetical protein
VSVVLTDLALLEEGHQSLTIHLDQTEKKQLALRNREGKGGSPRGHGGEKEKTEEDETVGQQKEPCVGRKICCGLPKI